VKILITGAFGYVGGRLTQHLLQADDKQLVLATRTARAAPPAAARATVAAIDWDCADSLSRACVGVDAIVHLAGMNAQQCSAASPQMLAVAGRGVSRLLEAAAAARVRRFIYLSTAHVYDPLQGVITEESPAVATQPYAVRHRAGEQAVMLAAHHDGMRGIVMRLSNAFGPPVREDADCWMLLVNALCRQASERRELVLRSGAQRRDFIALSDACRAIDHFLDLPDRLIGDGLFNVGGGWAPTVLQMAQRIATLCGETLGHRPAIRSAAAQPPAANVDLDYRIDKLLRTGFVLQADRDAEISATLRFCAAMHQGRLH